ncbi:MAG: hypothetical protein K0S74_183 [Chlamydiales bacterium]|jgi:phospholipid/cholesterol/gamma-HCH transport system substrate-binding protein|nr:hypothetical protein [Chlamydiales bacterium]
MTTINKNFSIGLFVLTALSIAVAALLFIRPSAGDGKETLKVRFTSIDKVSVGTRVAFAGKPVGDVTAIHTVENARQQKADATGRLFVYELVLRLDSRVQVYPSDEISLQTAGFFGEKVIAITPRKPLLNQPTGEPFKSGDVIYASSNEVINEALEQIMTVTDRISTTFENLSDLIKDNSDEFASTIKGAKSSFTQLQQALERGNQLDLVGSLHQASQQFGTVMETLGKQMHEAEELKLIETLAKTTENLSQITTAFNQPERLEAIVTNIETLSLGLGRLQSQLEKSWPALDTSLTNLAVTMDNAKVASENVKKIVDEVAEGKGNVGKFLKQDDLYLQVEAVLTKVETLMNDLNQYGLLFHNNRTWQKQRSQRMVEMSKIKTSEQMVSFFEQEIDQISTALSRMSKMAKIAESQTKGVNVEEQQQFNKAFREIFNKLEHVQDMIKLYNENAYGKAK